MNITQADIASLSDRDIVRLVAALASPSDDSAPRLQDFWRRITIGLVRASRDRRRALAVFELDLMNDDSEGALVEPGSDPVADALEELRRAARGESEALRRFTDGTGR